MSNSKHCCVVFTKYETRYRDYIETTNKSRYRCYINVRRSYRRLATYDKDTGKFIVEGQVWVASKIIHPTFYVPEVHDLVITEIGLKDVKRYERELSRINEYAETYISFKKNKFDHYVIDQLWFE